MRDLKIFTIAGLSAATIALMIGATVTSYWIFAGWGILTGMAAATITAWMLIEASVRREGVKLETLVTAVVTALHGPGETADDADVHRLR